MLIGGDGCRLHFWFKGVPEDRKGGPWWSRTFYSSYYKSAAAKRAELLDALKPFLHKAFFSGPDPTYQGDAPPDGAREVEL